MSFSSYVTLLSGIPLSALVWLGFKPKGQLTKTRLILGVVGLGLISVGLGYDLYLHLTQT